MDRFLGVLCAVTITVCTVVLVSNWSWGLFFWTLGLSFWAWTGLRKIEIGWRGQLLFIGQRMATTLYEGWRWIPFPFGLKMADCREQIMKLDSLKIFTTDQVPVKVDGSIVYRVTDLNAYFDVEVSGLKQGLDDVWDEVIRTQITGNATLANPGVDLDHVLAMHATLAQQARTVLAGQAGMRWGIRVVRVVVAAITPDDKVTEDLELRKRERLQRVGQLVEVGHHAGIVDWLQNGGTLEGVTIPPGLFTKEQAYELALFTTGKADPKKVFGVDAGTVTAITAAINASLGRRP